MVRYPNLPHAQILLVYMFPCADKDVTSFKNFKNGLYEFRCTYLAHERLYVRGAGIDVTFLPDLRDMQFIRSYVLIWLMH